MDAHFEQGMTAYAHGNCQGALSALALVAPQDKQERKAQLYSGLCQMHEGDLAAAASSLNKVVDAGDSQQLELALYYLAQIELARNNPAGANRFLARTISLQGDLEQRARLQDQKVLELEHKNRVAGDSGPAVK
jgi:tetratricopeptide (TPR) repeat protein